MEQLNLIIEVSFVNVSAEDVTEEHFENQTRDKVEQRFIPHWMRWESIKQPGSKRSDDQSMAAVRAGGSWERRNLAVVSGSLKPALKSLSCGWCMIGRFGYHSNGFGTGQNDK